MPRPNKARTLESEAVLARRIAFEREARGMSLEGLAKRMTDAGCQMHASAVHKIEKADPPRRITVNELVALSTVLDVPVAELLVPPEQLINREIRAMREMLAVAERQVDRATAHYREILERLSRFESKLESKLAEEDPAQHAQTTTAAAKSAKKKGAVRGKRQAEA